MVSLAPVLPHYKVFKIFMYGLDDVLEETASLLETTDGV